MKTIRMILAIALVASGGFLIGQGTTEKEYKRRALELPDDVECFSNRDIEHILYNEPLN
jgi:hypothetical protein